MRLSLPQERFAMGYGEWEKITSQKFISNQAAKWAKTVSCYPEECLEDLRWVPQQASVALRQRVGRRELSGALEQHSCQGDPKTPRRSVWNVELSGQFQGWNVGVRKKLPQDVPQWYTDYFELKAMLASGSRETSALPLNYLEGLESEVVPRIRDYHR